MYQPIPFMYGKFYLHVPNKTQANVGKYDFDGLGVRIYMQMQCLSLLFGKHPQLK